jgi:hypothetical protein
MASRATIAISQLNVGEQGYCPIDAVIVAPASPRGAEDGRDVAATAYLLAPEAEVAPEPSPTAKVHVSRRDEGYVIRLVAGEVPSRYLRRPGPGSIPVVAIE